jgi:hypothetical protein
MGQRRRRRVLTPPTQRQHMSSWDAILASAPLNTTAALVAGRSSDTAPEHTTTELSWDGPPPLLAITSALTCQPGFVDLTGSSVGRLKVLGLLAREKAGSNGAVWVCRCSCGRYVGRKSKSLKMSKSDRCNQCNYNAHLAWAASGNTARKRSESEQARKW